MLAIFHNSTFKIKLKQFTHIQHEHTNRPPTVPISAYRDTRTVLTDNELLMMDHCTNHFSSSLDCYEKRCNSCYNKK